ncbi:MAG: sulfatase-like hydrolase/transferase, partial [Opitutales bacterium]|nr:sulfatase-like hydrolase/transferase [Opitutales bacterium]
HMGTLSPKKPDQNRWGAFMEDPERYYCPPWERDVDVSFVTESKVPTWDPMKHPGGIKENASDEENALKGSKYGNEYFTGPGEVATVNVDGDDSRVLMDRAIPFIENAVESDTPFLAVIWFHTPHSPVVAGSKYKEMYSEYSDNEQHYYGCITAMDEQIGRLRSKLEELDVADDTMVWYCSDNGAARQGSPRHVGSVGGLTGFKLSLQEGGIRVPGLLVWPAKCPKRQTVTTPCVTTDYFPTILAALDIPLPDDRPYDGMSIWPLIEEPNWTRTKPIGFLHNGKVWMDYKYKLISKKEEEFRLYDIIADPAEKHDLAEKLPNVFRRMKAEFEPWHQSVLADLERVESR